MRTRVLAILAGIFLVAGVVQLLPGAKAVVTSLKPGGMAVAGDFNGDGVDDVAVGVPDENVIDPDNDNSVSRAGAVHVIHGDDGLGGLDVDNDLFISQELDVGDDVVGGSLVTNDRFGSAVAAGDFDNDGIDDLAIGVPFKDISGVADVGVVHVIYGSDAGLDAAGGGDNEIKDQIFHQNTPGVPGVNEAGDRWGSALVTGDFDGDGVDDLAIGTPLEAIGKRAAAGAVVVLYGVDTDGLKTTSANLWHQDVKGVHGVTETGDRFGQTLAVGDFNDDGADDLAVGAPGEGIGKQTNAGAVHVILGFNDDDNPTKDGLRVTGNRLWFQDSPAIKGVSEKDDRFAEAIGAGDLDGDGHDDLVVGVPGELCGDTCSGVIQVLPGGSGGLTTADIIVTQDKTKDSDDTEFTDDAEAGDQFGAVINVNDFDDDGFYDVAAGIPFEDIDGEEDAGAVEIIFGDEDVLLNLFSEFYDQAALGITEATEDHRFGAALVSGNFDGADDGADLVIGVPNQDVDGVEAAGAIVAAYNALPGGDEITQDDLGADDDGAEKDDHFGIALG